MDGEEFNRIQEAILKERAISAERVGWFSGASISLSFTLVGFLASKNYLIYLTHNHPFVFYVLILGWIFLAISIISSLLIRFLGQKWFYHTSSNLYLSANNDEFTEQINKINPELANSQGRKAKNIAILLRLIECPIYIGGILWMFLLVSFLVLFTSLIFFS